MKPKKIRPAGFIGNNTASIYACIGCGAERKIADSNIKRGERYRCNSCASKVYGKKIRTHYDSGKPLYMIWTKLSKDNTWRDYLDFKEWAMSVGYKEGLHAFKKETNLPFSPSNLIWSDHLGDYVGTANLRSTNTSGYTGVGYKQGLDCPWVSRVYYKGKTYNLGTYSTARKAASVRNQFIIEKGFPHKLADLY